MGGISPTEKPPNIENETMIEVGVCSAGLRTTQLPAANAGATFHAAMSRGKFHGIICPTTPNGSCRHIDTVLESNSDIVPIKRCTCLVR